ncbi:general odorant-binding protein 68 [Drosophila innubila]|uniref:general odorant-binding protein 68 n=1 Tax=Drosophila innubila TaxID=198719 RepID=UPI00148C698F|nr:general odorant-binding protein 68 [Drosophila innubila]
MGKVTFIWFFLALLLLKLITGIRIHCRDVKSIHEDHIHYCCKHPDGHNDVTESCAKKTKFKLPSRDEEALEDVTVDQAMSGTCWAKCVFDHYKFMDKDKLNMQAVRNHYQTNYKSDPEYVTEILSAFDHCHSKSEEATAEFLSTSLVRAFSSSAFFCKPMPSVVLACVIHKFFHNCPRSRWSNTTECVETLAFSKKCKDVLTTM